MKRIELNDVIVWTQTISELTRQGLVFKAWENGGTFFIEITGF
jgi:hypothetical protein